MTDTTNNHIPITDPQAQETYRALQDSLTSTPTKPKRRRLGLVVVGLLLVAALVAAVAYGVTQKNAAARLTKQRDTARHSLASTHKQLSATQSRLVGVQSDLDTANSTLATCSDVAKTSNLFFEAASHLLDALQGAPNDVADIDTANTYLDKVKALMVKQGYEGDLDGFVAACTGEASGTNS